MINYIVYTDNVLDSCEQVSTTSMSEAEDAARKMAASTDDNVFISFTNTNDDNNFGYLNWDGHSPVGKAWPPATD